MISIQQHCLNMQKFESKFLEKFTPQEALVIAKLTKVDLSNLSYSELSCLNTSANTLIMAMVRKYGDDIHHQLVKMLSEVTFDLK